MARHSKMAGALTAAEFREAVAKFRRLSAKAQEVAYAVLVDGMTFEEATERFATSRQLVHEWASKVYESYKPEGWETASVTLPADVMELVRKLEKEARADLDASRAAGRISRR